ncbi:alpha/beta hydrolase family protein [Rhodococcus sp. ARC_M6]|uniref:alpha/beta hydrolase n=1 Tax=Rhodococcus sp. ARC_M6 TaxID=2928852 RepID=UPI001FB27955|nr:alpha/beta hydrolase family protein [Rhodococcus sp. ARC_M6]MCJ0904421.1 esterase family protein [Rhodococcus sp. ARC_M6]
MRRKRQKAGMLAVALAVFALSCSNVAQAEPQARAHIDRIVQLTPTRSAVFVDSPSMRREMQVQVLHPENGTGTRPTFYLLDGVSAGSESGYTESTWTQKTDIEAFFADKDVNVVLPVGGTGSYYTDWRADDPNLGVNKWESFLADELPPLIDEAFRGNGTNAVGGVSMGALGAGNLITRNPDLYTGLASYSGCLDNSASSSQDSVRVTVASKNGDAANMWGPVSDPAWRDHDPSYNAETLRGKAIYISSSTGLPGVYDDLFTPDGRLISVVGGPLEALAHTCTQLFENRLDGLAIPAEVAYRDGGTHSWPYWQDALHDSWPTLRSALGL